MSAVGYDVNVSGPGIAIVGPQGPIGQTGPQGPIGGEGPAGAGWNDWPWLAVSPNVLSEPQSTFETLPTGAAPAQGWLVSAANALVVDTPVRGGSRALQVSPTATGAFSLYRDYPVPPWLRGRARMRASIWWMTPSATTRTLRMYTQAGATLTNRVVGPFMEANPGVWQQSAIEWDVAVDEAFPPAGARIFFANASAGTAGELFYFDDAVITWSPLYQDDIRTAPARMDDLADRLRSVARNGLTAEESGFEGGTLGDWQTQWMSLTNVAGGRGGGRAVRGLTSSSSGQLWKEFPLPGHLRDQPIIASGWSLPHGSPTAGAGPPVARTFGVGFSFYDDTDTIITAYAATSTVVNQVVGTWVRAETLPIMPPSNAVKVRVIYQVSGVGLTSGDAHLFDDLSVTWAVPRIQRLARMAGRAATKTALHMAGAAGAGYALGPAGLGAVLAGAGGGFDIRCQLVYLGAQTNGQVCCIAAPNATTGAGATFRIAAAGTAAWIAYFMDSGGTQRSMGSVAMTPLGSPQVGDILTLRYWNDVDAGMWRNQRSPDGGATWINMVNTNPIAGSTGLLSDATHVARTNINGISGPILWMEVRKADGEILASCDFTAAWNTRYRDKQGNTWTLEGGDWAWTTVPELTPPAA